jgi:hypothetical protein
MSELQEGCKETLQPTVGCIISLTLSDLLQGSYVQWQRALVCGTVYAMDPSSHFSKLVRLRLSVEFASYLVYILHNKSASSTFSQVNVMDCATQYDMII